MTGFRGTALGLVLVLLTGTVRAQEPETAPDSPQGPIVTAVEVRSDAPLDESFDLETLVETEVGQPLDEEEIRHTLRNLQATGTASEIELYTREDPERGGVVVVIVFRAVVQVEEVRITGRLGLGRDTLRRAIPQLESEPLSEERVLRGVYAIEELYQNSGYFEGRAHVAVQTDEARRRAVVLYNVDSGPRATVSTIAFDKPVAPFEPAALVRQLRDRPGEGYSQRLAREDAERLQDWLVRQRHGAARVDPPRVDRDPASNTVKLTYPIEIGPRIVLSVLGGDEKALRRRGLLPFLGEAGYDEALVLQSVSRMKSYYQEQGYYDVRIDTEEKRTNGDLVLTFHIETGPEYTLREIALEGNEEISGADLRQVMQTAKRSLLRPGSGRLVQSELDEDLENLRRYYALHGYLRAEVGPAQVEKQGQDLRLVIPIREGPRQRVVDLGFEGIAALDVGELRRNLSLKAGEGFHPVLLENDLDQIRARYAALGYVQAQVSARQDWNPDHLLVDVTFEVLEGPRQVADRIIVRGNERTQSEVIRRTLGLRQGEPISEVRILETERNLYRLGVFSRVDVELVRAGLDTTERDVLVRVEEGQPRTVTYGLGWDSVEHLRGLVGFTDNNILGRAYSLRTDLRWSQEGDQRFRFIFNQPYLFEQPISLTTTLFYQSEARGNRPFEATRGARVEAVRIFTDRRVSLGLDYRIVDLDLDPAAAANTIELLDRKYRVNDLVPSFFWDRRNDPITPTRGWSSLLQLQYAFPSSRTDTELLKVFAQQTQYLDLGRPGVVAASLRVGGIEPLSTLVPTEEDPLAGFPSRDVPIGERFFAGGDTTHRAYGRDELGIRGQSLLLASNQKDYIPVGGNGLLLLNLEYRFPIFGDFGGTVFFDTGDIWPDWRSISFSGLKNGVGLGARYVSPIGPIRAGIGWKLDREPGEPSYELFFNIGNPF
ncbi:MAG TPA: outer membrane protein assembly factor BamA [Thermoanaerobaculia bacterium]|nr:outer membrane protein assembly factor BamA [Thermoanaerobaculia bacterium]